jgi:hypothetical protein
MPSWDADAETSHPLDFRLVHNSPVTMFWNVRLLEQATQWLREHNYDVTVVDASGWTTAADMLREIGTALEFPDYYGRSLDAFNDCMRDVASADYGVRPDATGLVLAFLGFDHIATSHPTEAHAVLDIFAGQARNAMLIGRRMICLVQTDNARLSFAPVGATPVVWNDAEFLNSKRGL